MAKITSPLTGSFVSLKKQFISKEKLIKSSLILQKKNSETRRKNSERESRINYESVLERTLGFLGRPIKSIGKRMSFLDSLKQFITSTLLGFIGIRLLKYLPQLLRLLPLFLKVGDFILDMSGKLLNGLVTFVDKGYQAADNAKKLVKSIGGQKAIDALDSMNNQTNSLLNSILIAGMLFTDFGGVGTGGPVAQQAIESSTDIIEGTIKQEGIKRAAQEAAKQGVRSAIGPLGATGIILGVGLLSSALGEGAFQIKRFGKQLESWTTGKFAEASQDKNPITRFLKKGFFGWLSKTLGPAIWLLNGTGVMFDIVGAPFRYGVELIRAAIMKLNDDQKGLEKQNKNLGKFDARVRDGIREHFSILAPLFKFVGMKGVSQKLQTPGSFGSLYGEKAARDMGYYRGGLVIKKFAGGGYTRTVGDENKVQVPRTFERQLSNINPGSAIGGEKMIEKVFPYTQDNITMNQYNFIVNSQKNLSNVDSLGSLMGLTIKSVMGSKISDQDYNIVSDSISNFLMRGIYDKNPEIYRQIVLKLGSDGLSSTISGEITKILSDTFGQIQSQLRIQLGLKEPEPESGVSPTSEDCACPDSDQQFVTTGNAYEKALLETISQVEGTSGPDGYRTMFGGGKFSAPPWKHPDTVVRSGGYASAAAGKYQFMPGTWASAAKALGLTDFSPANQDKAALWLVKNRGVNPSKQLTISDFEVLGKEWAGLSPYYGQTSRTAAQSYNIYLDKLKKGGATPSANIATSSSAVNIDPCECDPEIPDATNIGGQVQPAGETSADSVSGYPITSRFGPRWGRNHGGVDVGAPQGKPIAIRAPGEVAFAGFSGGYGNVVDIWVPSLKQMFRMAHMRDTPSVTKGQKTVAGQLLGYVGSTGSSTGAHVHFESHDTITSAYGSKDPMPYIKYLTIGREYGGPTLTGGMRLLHKGEYVIDKDSVDLFGGNQFFSLINNVENEKQRASSSSKLIEHLSKYTGRKIDQKPDVIFEEDESEIMMSPPMFIPISSAGGSSGGGSSDYEYDMLSMRS
jgi:murein DD-endopeptidase MepM/ murein hydrolase activator NlpD